jgi:hypothetical protein
VADNVLFRNCLIAMRPRATRSDLPSSHDVKVHLHNQSVEWLEGVKKDILVSCTTFRLKYYSPMLVQAAPGKVSTTADGWTADNTKGSFLGVTAHWIEVKGGKWRLRSEVIGFQAISGDHGGLNIGRYFVGLLDRVGITSHDKSKVIQLQQPMEKITTNSQLCTVTLDNASSNNTSCATIETLHDRRGYEHWAAAENQLP